MTVQVYFAATPNGRKVTIALEEMGLAYDIIPVSLAKNEQLHPDFLKLSPNGRIPAIVDHAPGGEGVVIFESGAILQYLGRKSGLFYPTGEAQRAWVDAWVFWQMAGLGPMAGQLNWFHRATAAPGRDQRYYAYPINRYDKEVRRLYGVLERQLTGRDFIADDYSIADMACWPWVDAYHHQLGDLARFPSVQAWRARIAARPAVDRALRAGAT